MENRENLLENLYKIIDDRHDRIATFNKRIANRNTEIAKMTEQIEILNASQEFDKAASIAQDIEGQRIALQYEQESLDKMQHEKVFIPGTLWSEWEKIAESKRSKWNERVEKLKAAKADYEAAAHELKELSDYLTLIRREIVTMGKNDGENITRKPILSTDSDFKDCMILPTDPIFNDIRNMLDHHSLLSEEMGGKTPV